MRRILFVLAALSAGYGCSTDFDVIAPYKEVMVIDGLLNVKDTVQNIRISKAFLGEGDAVIMAQQKDSINYANILHVRMTELKTGITFDLTRNEQNNKDSGTFAYPFVVLYSTNHILDATSEYKIAVTNSETGVTATSQTQLVGNNTISPPIQDPIDLASQFPSPVLISYGYSREAFIHELRVRFHYREIDQNGITSYHYTDWNLGEPKTLSNVEAKYAYYKDDFYSFLQLNIPDSVPGHIRRIDSLETGKKTIEYLFVQGSEDLQTYIQLNRPTSGSVTEKPLFTTVENGIGLFTSRLIRSEYRNVNQVTQDFMDTTHYLNNKGFQFH